MALNQLFLGDCLELLPRVPTGKVDLILCDLPYGTTQNKWDSIIPLVQLWEQYRRIIKPNGAIVLTAADPFTSLLICSNLKEFKYKWVWEKETGTGHLNAKRQPMRSTEDIPVFYALQPTYNPQMVPGKPYTAQSKGNGRAGNSKNIPTYGFQHSAAGADNQGERYPKNVIRVRRETGKERGLHPTQKPVALFEYLINTYTNPGEIVLDNCMGSGTTAIAAINTGRNWVGMEKDPQIFNDAQARISQHLANRP